MANNTVDLFAVNPHAAFHINGNINSYTVHFMLDTRAATSLLDAAKTWDKIKGNRHYEKYGLFHYVKKPSHATTKSTPFAVNKDEWDAKEDTGKSMKNTLYILRYTKIHLSC